MPTDIWLIMEKGAVKRFMGIPRETEKSLLLKVNWEMKIRYHFRRFIEHSMKYGICGKNGLLTKRQVAVALKQAGLPMPMKTVSRYTCSGFAYSDAIINLAGKGIRVHR